MTRPELSGFLAKTPEARQLVAQGTGLSGAHQIVRCTSDDNTLM
jgi:hypothetical protein